MVVPNEFDHYQETYRSQIDDAVAFSGQSHDFFTRVKANYLIDLIGELIQTSRAENRPISVLDVGCGHGHIHPYLMGAKLKLNLTGRRFVIGRASRTRRSRHAKVASRPVDLRVAANDYCCSGKGETS